jgi:UDP-N-acetylglucosamine 4,6-dehydratase
MNIDNRDDYSILIGVRDEELAIPVMESLKPLNTSVIIGNNIPSFSKLVNDAIMKCNKDIFIFCSHRVRPTKNDIQTLLNRIDEGHGLVTLYRLACFGFKKELIKRIGFFDERYLVGGWEDDDFNIRLKEADISYYEDESITYIKGESLWKHPENKPKKSFEHYRKKWIIDNKLGTICRTVGENTNYNIGRSDTNIVFKKWDESVIKHVSSWLIGYNMIEYKKYIYNKKILIFGGTGSLGKKLVEMYGKGNNISIFSRDENKHWNMCLHYNNLNFILGDIRDSKSVKDAILRTSPDIIIIASALKHIDRCEYEVNQTYMTNSMGVMNVLDVVKYNYKDLVNLESVVFISTDKACSPINTYGMSKALAEKMVVETAYKLQNSSSIKFMSVRYGNVLNSRGSIIEAMDKIGNSIIPEYKLNHPNMTRFIMTQEDSVKLINYAIQHGESGDILIPKTASMSVKNMIELYANKYNKKIVPGKVRPGEKIHEDLINEYESTRCKETDRYYIIKPPYKNYTNEDSYKYSSHSNIITQEQLYEYLTKLKLI